jgi:hypothetical protein
MARSSDAVEQSRRAVDALRVIISRDSQADKRNHPRLVLEKERLTKGDGGTMISRRGYDKSCRR